MRANSLAFCLLRGASAPAFGAEVDRRRCMFLTLADALFAIRRSLASAPLSINPRLECNRYGRCAVAAALAVQRGKVVVDVRTNAWECCVLN